MCLCWRRRDMYMCECSCPRILGEDKGTPGTKFTDVALHGCWERNLSHLPRSGGICCCCMCVLIFFSCMYMLKLSIFFFPLALVEKVQWLWHYLPLWQCGQGCLSASHFWVQFVKLKESDPRVWKEPKMNLEFFCAIFFFAWLRFRTSLYND